MAAIVGAGACLALADSARERDDLANMDPAVTQTAVHLRDPGLSQLATAVTWLGSTAGVLAAAVLVAVVVTVMTRSWRAAMWLVVALAGSAALTVIGQAVVGRGRPPAGLVIGSSI